MLVEIGPGRWPSVPAGPRLRAFIWGRPESIVGAGYVVLATLVSLTTPAWESNDEIDHYLYVQRVAGGSLPRIDIANGHESHQPPLYYVLAAAWQWLLGIRPDQNPATPGPSLPSASLALSHDYTHAQHNVAVHLHEVRLLSVLLGLVTVLCCGGALRRLGFDRPVVVCGALTVALWPKLIVITTTVTNDSAVVAACAVLCYSAVRWWAAPSPGWAIGVGLAAGAALLAKYNAVPVVAVVLTIAIIRACRNRWFSQIVVAGVAATAVCGWWFVRNLHLYGSLGAQKASNDYLSKAIPGLIAPTSYADRSRFLDFVPSQLRVTLWYDGSWNQLKIPVSMGLTLSLFAAVCAGAFVVHIALSRDRRGPAILAVALAGLVAVVIVARDTTQAEGRVMFVALPAIAAVLVLGARALAAAVGGAQHAALAEIAGAAVWPVILLGVDAYVAARFVVPHAGL